MYVAGNVLSEEDDRDCLNEEDERRKELVKSIFFSGASVSKARKEKNGISDIIALLYT